VIPLSEARSYVLDRVKPLAVTSVGLPEALGLVLAETVTSREDVPAFANTAMDGFALRAADTAGAPVELEVIGTVAAGDRGDLQIARGQAARIMTGAVMPRGADAVVMQEECVRSDGQVRIPRRISRGENVRPRANDIRKGSRVLHAGQRLQPQALGLLASLGMARVRVRPRLRVALLSSGDELLEPGQGLAAGRIYDANRYSLGAALVEAGCTVVVSEQVADTFDASCAALHAAAERAHLIIGSGGVSVGEEDHMRTALTAQGELHLWRVRMKPGKPLAFGQLRGVPFLGLPGNPVSAFVTLCLFGLPFVRAMQGRRQTLPSPGRALLRDALEQPLMRREYVRVRLQPQPRGLPVAEPFPRQSSDVLCSTVWAEGVLELPEDTALPAGAELNYWSFRELMQ